MFDIKLLHNRYLKNTQGNKNITHFISFSGYNLRITGSGHNRYGRLKITDDGKWGNVCGPAPNYGLTPEDALVLCRQFGLTDGQIIPSGSFGDVAIKDEIRLTDIRCRGTEESIWNCSYDVITNWRPKREDHGSIEKIYVTSHSISQALTWLPIVCKNYTVPSKSS